MSPSGPLGTKAPRSKTAPEDRLSSAAWIQRGHFPVVAGAAVAEDVELPVLDLHLEIPLLRHAPAFYDLQNIQSLMADIEASRLLFAALAGIGVDTRLDPLYL